MWIVVLLRLKFLHNPPLVDLLLMRFIDGKKIKSTSVVGVILGIIGIYLLVCQQEIITQDGTMLGIVMIFICMLSWRYGSLFVAKADLPSNFFVNTGYQMITGSVMLLIVSLLFGEVWIFPTEWSQPVQISMVLLIIFGGLLVFTAFKNCFP